MSNNEFTPPCFPQLPRTAFAIFIFYMTYKLVIRSFTGTKLDKRKWGVETYIAAAVHQINCFLLGVYLIYRVYNLQDYSLYSKWLALSFFDSERNAIFKDINTLDGIFVLGQSIEMLTDFLLYLRYPAFGKSYCIHHMTTLLCSTSSFFAVVPVGAPIVVTTVMETGGLALNVVSMRTSLWPKVAPPAWIFTFRLYFYTCSRIIAAIFISLMTPHLFGSPTQIICMALIYALLFVNLSWVYTMWKTKFKVDSRRKHKSMAGRPKNLVAQHEKEMAGFAD